MLLWGTFFVNFAIPMVMLMSRDAKRNPRFLIFVGSMILIGHWLDVILMVMPGALGHDFHGSVSWKWVCSWPSLGVHLHGPPYLDQGTAHRGEPPVLGGKHPPPDLMTMTNLLVFVLVGLSCWIIMRLVQVRRLMLRYVEVRNRNVEQDRPLKG
jgi:hypothetical protein